MKKVIKVELQPMSKRRHFIVLLNIVAVLTVVASALSCGKLNQKALSQSPGADPKSPVTEAFRMLDRGENAQAAEVMENYLAEHPTDLEAKMLLSSAYARTIGIDIIALSSTFQDVLFKKSLGETILGTGAQSKDQTKESADEQQLLEKMSLANAHETKAGLLLQSLDLILVKIKRVTEYLDRFPTIPESQWSLLDQAIHTLPSVQEFKKSDPALQNENATSIRGLYLYRLMLQAIRIKSFIQIKFLNTNLGEIHRFICHGRINEIEGALRWLNSEIQDGLETYYTLKPEKLGSLDVVLKLVSSARASVSALAVLPPSSEKTLRNVLKDQIKCTSQN